MLRRNRTELKDRMEAIFSITLADLHWRQSTAYAFKWPLCDCCNRFITPQDKGFPIYRSGGREQVMVHFGCAKERTKALPLCPARNRNRY